MKTKKIKPVKQRSSKDLPELSFIDSFHNYRNKQTLKSYKNEN